MTHSLASSWARTGLAILTLSFAVACDDGDGRDDAGGTLEDGSLADAATDGSVATTPTVTSSVPMDGATDVARNDGARVLFSEAMDPASLTATTFTLTSGDPRVVVPGTVVAGALGATFWPSEQLASDTTYTATVTSGALSAAGVSLEADHVFSFTTGDSVGPGLPVDLGAAGDYTILAKSAISTVPTSTVNGDIGLSPAAATFITGFSLMEDPTNVFATSTQSTGRVYAADYAVPTPANLTMAVSDMEIAFTNAAARAADVTELGAGDIGGRTLARGVYKWGTGLLIPSDVTLSGSAADVWIFQIAGDLTVASGVRINLEGGALPQNVFWQVAGLVDLGTTSHLEGIILTQTSVTLRTGATVDGRILAQTSVAIDGSTVIEPAD